MGFFGNVKKGAKSYVDQYKKTSADNRAYKQEVGEAVKQARREAFKKEAVKQAQLRAKIQAKQKFNPTPTSAGGGMSAEARSIIYGGGFGSQMNVPKEKVVTRIVQNRSPKKKKKKKPQTRTIIKYVEKKTPKDAVQDLLSRLPE